MSLEVFKEEKDNAQARAEIFIKAVQNKDLIKDWVLAEASQIDGEGALHFAYVKGVETAIDFIKKAFEEEGLIFMIDPQEVEEKLKDQFEELGVGEEVTPEQLFETGYKLASTTARENF